MSSVVTTCAVFLLLTMSSGDRARAATRTVNSTSDGLTPGTLRYEVLSAGSGDTIFLAAGTGKTPITLSLGEIVLDKNLTITADKKKVAKVSANGSSRIFRVTDTATVRIENVVLSDGNSTQDLTSGGGILNFGVLTLTNVSMIRNISGEFGGAVHNAGATLTVINCVFTDNYARRYAGGVASIGANAGYGSLLIQGSTFTRNSADEGSGAILNVFGNFTITSSSLKNNKVTTLGSSGISAGGAIGIVNTLWNSQPSMITGCTISGNSSDGGGGVAGYQADILIVGSKISGNTASSNGSGIWDSFGKLKIENSTLTGNVSSASGCICFSGSQFCTIVGSKLDSNISVYGGGICGDTGTLDIKQSAITNNTSQHGGGGIWCDVDNLLVSDTDFTNNNCTQSDGGAIRAMNCGNVVFTGNRIRYNNAFGYGGGLAFFNCLGTISNSKITNNTSGQGGNDVYLNQSTVDFQGTVYGDLKTQ